MAEVKAASHAEVDALLVSFGHDPSEVQWAKFCRRGFVVREYATVGGERVVAGDGAATVTTVHPWETA